MTAGERLTRAWRTIRHVVLKPEADPESDSRIAELARGQAPTVWLLGKVQSGKTTIVRAITGDPEAEIGRGYKPCTRTARIYDFPPEAPVIRFLDTQGLGEVGYDPTEDLAELEGRTHVVLAVARAMDPQQAALLDVLAAVRKRHPDWALVVAQTALHEGYADGADHPPYAELGQAAGLEDLRRSLASQAEAFRELPGSGAVHVVPVDLTPPEEGYSDPRFGLEALLAALEQAGSAGMDAILQSLVTQRASSPALLARPHVLGYALAAAATDVVPVLGLVTVPTIQGKLLHSIARIYGVRWNAGSLRRFAASLGTGTVLGIGLSLSARQLAKLVPVYGQTIGAAAAGATSFSVTYALGKAACYYLDQERSGGDIAQVARVYRESLSEAFAMVRNRKNVWLARNRDDE